MNIEDIKNRFQTVANSNTGIETFVFDDLSAINIKRQKKYPVVLMKTPSSAITPFTTNSNEILWENYNLTFYILKPWTNQDKKTKPLETVYKDCEVLADGYLRDVLALGLNEYSLIGDKTVTKARGHHQHVDQLVGVQYDFILRVFNSLCPVINQPTNLVATPLSTTEIDLTWTDNATNETAYEVWRSLDGIDFVLIVTLAADSTSYSDTGLTPGTVYYYKIRAINLISTSLFSNVVAQRTDPLSPSCAIFTAVINEDGTEVYSESWLATDTNIININ